MMHARLPQGCGHNSEDLLTDPGAGNALWGSYAWGYRRCADDD
jgi:hypothetical protein